MDHKIICWGDYQIPVSFNYKYMAWDKNGEVFMYVKEPSLDTSRAVWLSSWYEPCALMLGTRHVPPPEPGEWDTQLYEI